MSLRKLARMAEVSDPYLSQIERGLRRPSADVLQRLASALQVRAETLYYKAGILSEPTDDLAVRIAAEPSLTESQKRALIEIFESFRAAQAVARDESVESAATGTGHDLDPPPPGLATTPTESHDEKRK